jgi:cytochrome c peroxidase
MLPLNVAKDQAKTEGMAKNLASGVKLFFGKARCNSCHVGDNFTDNTFHNLGVGVKDGKIPPNSLGRFAAMPVGAKDPNMVSAFKTPTLRGLIDTGPYMHDGSEKTLEEVIDFYDKGGNPNRYLDVKMRDFEAEKAYILAKKSGKKYTGPKVYLFGPDETPVVPLELKLTAQEKKDLVLFMKALQGDPVDPIVADPNHMPPLLTTKKE